MSLDKLFIFSKNTDAAEALRGYEYQKLRALEAWLDNYHSKNNQIIYCDYEEDIFQRDLDEWSSKFTQLKLYSSKNFSFSSVEVTKAISHFFMLFVKGEYKFDNQQFIFETNADIARKYKDNDAELLKKWREHQGSLDPKLLKKCADKVKSIVFKYSESANEGVKDLVLLEKIKAAKLILTELPDEVWERFARTIKWNFSDISAEKAVEEVIERINRCISKLENPIAQQNEEIVFARLYYAVSERSIQIEGEDRKLNAALLDQLLLDSGDEEDKWYNKDYQVWSKVTTITSFRTAEFLKVLNSSFYCRYAGYLKHHWKTWATLLKQYIDLPDIPKFHKQKAIYELIWTTLRPQMLAAPDGTLEGMETHIRNYFDVFEDFSDVESLEDASALVGVVQGTAAYGKVDISEEEISYWRERILQKTIQKIDQVKDPNQICYYHAIAALLILHNTINPESEIIMDDTFVHLDEILKLLESATQYDVKEFSNRLTSFIKILITLEHEIEEIERLEEFTDKLMPVVAKKSSDHDLAKVYVDRGVKYLHTTEPKSVLRAINYFHKAKTLWRHDHTRDGHILVLINISQLYLLIGCNFAAKYYALTAARHATFDSAHNHRISDAFAMILNADFKEGAWISCLEDFRLFILYRGEFKSREYDDEDNKLMNSLRDIAIVIALAPRLSPEVAPIIASEVKEMGQLYKDILEPMVDELNGSVGDTELVPLLQKKLDDAPLNDGGQQRTIFWDALGNKWKFSFENDWLTNSIAEEFIAVLQILVADLGLSKTDLHLLESQIEIDIELGERWEPPFRLASNDIHKWIVKVPAIIQEDLQAIQMQCAFMAVCIKKILDEISLLPTEELENEIQQRLEKEDLAGKTMVDFLYQRLYRFFIEQKYFDEPNRASFEKLDTNFTVTPFPGLAWDDSLSSKYSTSKSLEMIHERYPACMVPMHLTLARLQKDPRYPDFIKRLREKGWLDWQILLALFNHTVSYKVSIEMQRKTFHSAQEEYDLVQEAFGRLFKLNEEENYIVIPLDYYFEGDLDFQLRQAALLTLRNWGLNGQKSDFPDFNAVKNLMVKRFNFNIDDETSLSPL